MKAVKGGEGWIDIPRINHTPYTQELLAELRKGPILRSAFPHILDVHDKISTLRKLLPEGHTIEGKRIWTKGKFGTYRELQYRLTTPSRLSKQGDS